MKTAPTNPTALIQIFSSNIGEFLSFAIALANGLAKLTQPPPSLSPEQIFIEKENNNYIITIDTNNASDDFSKNLFISPEINKEIDRDIDTRSLIYSLGIIFHLLLTKEYPNYGPFISVNFSANETVPQTIQLIIEKMLSRFPEDRYQSFSGLLSDLSKAKKDHEKTGNISPFFPGVEDKPIALNFGNYLYGRENEFTYIINESDKCLNSLNKKNAFFIIHGRSGVGKTHLANFSANELYTKDIIFIKFKFDEASNSSFNGISHIIHQIWELTLSTKCPTKLKKKITKTIEKYAQLIANILPNISFEFDRNDTSLDNHHLNFSNLLIDIFQEITSDHQLIIQIDDLQWIDTTSLTPILLATSYISKNLVIISTTRQHLIEDEPLINQLYKEKGIPTPRLKKSFKHLNIHLIELNGIKEEDIIDQVEDLLSCTINEAKSLAGVLKKKTEGNPLHIQQLLVSFKEKNILWFDTQKNEWTWKLSELEKEFVTENVADLLIKKISGLPTNTQNTLHFASLIVGGSFSTKFIASLLNQDIVTVELSLWHAFAKQIIIQTSTTNDGSNYKFVHDKIQQACKNESNYNLSISHKKIGNFLLKNHGKNASAINLEQIIHHLNKSIGQLTNTEIHDLIQLNKLYGDQLLTKLHDPTSEKYYSIAINLYQNFSIENKSLLEKLYFSKVKACQLAGDTKQALQTLSNIEKELSSVTNVQRALLKKLDILTVSSKYENVLSIGIHELKKGNHHIKLMPNQFEIVINLVKTIIRLLLHLNKLTALPKKTSSMDEFYSKIYCELASSGYFYNKKTYIQIIYKNILFALNRGVSIDNAFIFMQFSNIMLVKFSLYKLAYILSRKSFDLMKRFEFSDYNYQTTFVYTVFLSRWFETNEIIIKKLEKSINECEKANHFTFLTYAIAHCLIYQIVSGKRLKNVEEFINKHHSFMFSGGLSDTIYTIEIAKCFIESLKSGKEHYSTQIFNETTSINEMKKNGLTVPYGLYFIWKLKSFYFLEKLDEADRFGNIAKNNLDLILGLNEVEEYHFYHGLTKIELAIYHKKKLLTKDLKKVKTSIRLFKKWKKQNPKNYKDKYELLLGTFYEYKGNIQNAKHEYKHSIISASETNNLPILSLANQKMAAINKVFNNEKDCHYLSAAIENFRRWGAIKKAELISKNKS